MFSKLFVSLLTLIISLIPTWLFLLAYNLLDPSGFWQQFLVIGVGAWLLGGLQLVFFIIWIGILGAVVFND